MVAGRNASGMASELGSMQVTEQIDAMRALGTDPSQEAGDAAAVFCHRCIMLVFLDRTLRPRGAWPEARRLRSSCCAWMATQYWILSLADTGATPTSFMGLIKPLLFGFIIATVGCYYGLSARGRHAGRGPRNDAGRWSSASV